MSIEKMSLVHIIGGIEALDTALMKCCESGVFHVEYPEVSAKMGFVPLRENNPYIDTFTMVRDVMKHLELPPCYRDYSTLEMEEDDMHSYLTSLRDEIVAQKDHIAGLRERMRNHEQALVQARHLEGLDFRLADIMDSENSTARFGKLPADNFQKLGYFSNHTFFFFDFDHDDEYYWGFYVAPDIEIEPVDRIFNSLYFEVIDISGYAHETPQHAVDALETQIAVETDAIARAEADLALLKKRDGELIEQVYSKLRMLHDTFSYRRYATTSRSRFYLEGFVPQQESVQFQAGFESLPNVLCEVEEITPETRTKPPVKLKTNRFFKPFEMYVEMYGLPGYHDFNPTSFIGFVYVLLFGMMFGDLGQGAVLILFGWLSHRYKGFSVGPVLTRCGVASMVFGLVYGSFFGIEDCFRPFWNLLGLGDVLPLHVLDSDTSLVILAASLGIGVLCIIAAITANIIRGLRKKDYGKAVFSNNGIAGLLFYGGVVAAALVMLLLDVNVFHPLFILFVIVLPLMAMFFHEPLGRKLKKRRKQDVVEGERFSPSDAGFEMFEILLSFATNTLSFLRVGGFVLSHAALMLVVMTFAHMAGSVGSIVVMILGNLFVMALEGLLVSIQVLRLVYYEMFSRFYESDGEPYRPVKITYAGRDKP